jgi:hypothetical protein
MRDRKARKYQTYKSFLSLELCTFFVHKDTYSYQVLEEVDV